MSESLPDHLEQYLGTIEHGYSDEHARPLPVQIVSFLGRINGAVPFATLGLSRHALISSYNGKQIHEEVIMLVVQERAAVVPAIMHQVVAEALDSRSAFLRGSVIGPRGALFAGTAMEALYIGPPRYLPHEFATFHGAEAKVIIPWLIPITHAEAHYIFDRGWPAFEDLLLQHQPDLVDVDRPSIV